MRVAVPVFVLVAFAAGGIGYGASHYLDASRLQQMASDRDQARDCRHMGATLSPCPVIYRNTKIEWRDRVETVEAPDRGQRARIAELSAELEDARHRMSAMERRRVAPRLPRWAAYVFQNGTIAHPYYADDRCPADAVIVYQAAGAAPARRSGDPNVCYVRRIAYSSGR